MRGLPVGGLPARAWRRLEQQARSAHDEETLSAARALTGALNVIVAPSAVAVLRLREAGWQLALAETVAPTSLHGRRCWLVAVGRYGRYWWVRLLVDGRSVTLLGSHLRVTPVSGGGAGGSLDPPTAGESILESCERGCRSVTSLE